MTNRYRELPTKVHVDEAGRRVAYVSRRFLPPVDDALNEYVRGSGERLDNLAARYLGAPTLYWQICDANRVLDPAELEAVAEDGRAVRIAISSGGRR